MDIRQLRYFVDIARTENFSKAAAKLRIAQPALSRQIRLLEAELGIKLFDRHRQGAKPTAEGRLLLSRAEFLVHAFEQVRHELKACQTEPSGPVAIGFSSVVSAIFGAPLAQQVASEFPGVRLRLVESMSPRLEEMLIDGQLDLAVLNGPISSAGIIAESIGADAICLIGLSSDRRLPKRPVKIQELAGIPLILTGITKAGVRLELESAASRRSLSLDVRCEVDTMGTAKGMVFAGLGLTVHVQASIIPELAAGRLRATPIEGLSLRRVLGRPSGRPSSRAAIELFKLMNALIPDLVASGAWPGLALSRDR